MAPRPVGTATIAFGLVNIPVRLYSAANPSAAVSFRLLSRDGHRLKQQYVDPRKDNVVVPRNEMVKGYEIAKDQYVIFEEAELKELKELQKKATQAIDIAEFVPRDQIPAHYHAKTYHLGPDKGGDRAYRLLSEAMEQTGRAGLARYAARGKMYLVLVAPRDGGLVMHQLHYPDELTSFDEVPKGEAEVTAAEVELAVRLIDQIAKDRFEPEAYEDEVKKRLEVAIQRKREGQVVTEAPADAPKAHIVDLMEALKASLGEPAASPAPAPAEPAEPAPEKSPAKKTS